MDRILVGVHTGFIRFSSVDYSDMRKIHMMSQLETIWVGKYGIMVF